MEAIDINRITVAASQSLGVAEGAFDQAVKYSKERVQFGKPIAQQQGLGWYMAEMKARIEAARWLVYYGAWRLDQELPCTMDSAIAKLIASETAQFVTDLALQIHGGFGYMKDYPIERMYRDARITRIYEGASEIQKLVIARNILK
jgi:alkylation response protein AidB-like acyl-CoA dehydrogenase